MNFVKKSISFSERWRWFKSGLEWLSLTHIPSWNADEKRWRVAHLSWQERFDCFYAGIETAILGYVYIGS